jgi:hypothetical protein
MTDSPTRTEDERISLAGVYPEDALRTLLKVGPDAGPVEHVAPPEERCPKTWMGKRCLLKAGHFGPCQYQA